MPLRHLKDSRAIFLQTGGGGAGTLTDAVLSLNGIQDHINLSGTGNLSGITIDIIPTGSGILISGSGLTPNEVENYLLNISPTFLSAVDEYVADIDLINGLSGTNGEISISGLGGVQVTAGTGVAGEDVVYISGAPESDTVISQYWQKTGDDLYYESGNVAIGGLPTLNGEETFVVSSSGGAVISGIDLTIKDGTGIAHDKILVGSENQIESGVALYSHQITISGNPVSTGYASGINLDSSENTYPIYAGNSGGLHPSILQFKNLSGTGGLEIFSEDNYLIISGGAGGGTVKDVVHTTGDQTGISGKKTFLDDLTIGDNLSGYVFQVEDDTVSVSGVLDVTGSIFLNGDEITGVVTFSKTSEAVSGAGVTGLNGFSGNALISGGGDIEVTNHPGLGGYDNVVLISGEGFAPTDVVQTTGDQPGISGEKTFIDDTIHSGEVYIKGTGEKNKAATIGDLDGTVRTTGVQSGIAGEKTFIDNTYHSGDVYIGGSGVGDKASRISDTIKYSIILGG